jgi:putative nucleotidyltransferase with HDIG domain
MKKLPAKEECLKLLKKYCVSEEHYKAEKDHVESVAKTALFLANKLKQAGVAINLDLVECGALLHDLGKTKNDPCHSETARKLLLKEGYPKIADIAGKHGLRTITTYKTWEQKVVVYSDARTGKATELLQSLDKRRELFIQKHEGKIPDVVEQLSKSVPNIRKIENKIFSKINMKPEELSNYL